MPINKKTAQILLEAVESFKQQPFRLNIGVVMQELTNSDFPLARNPEKNPCGSVCCLFGHIAEIKGVVDYAFVYGDVGYCINDKKARELLGNAYDNHEVFDDSGAFYRYVRLRLGLNPEQASNLFYLSRWPKNALLRYEQARNGYHRVAALRERVKAFIQEEGIEEKI